MFKTAPALVKAAEDDDGGGEGIIEALVATYDLDSGGDRIVPGAFEKTLSEWKESGTSIPFIWSHMHDDLDAYLGDVLDAKETDDGLWVKAQIDLDDDRSRKAYKLLKGGRVRNYSFAYEVLDSEEKDGVNELKQLKLFEVGPTLIGMNQQTRTLVVKAMRDDAQHFSAELKTFELKAGRVISAANEQSLREASEAIARVLAQLDSQPDADEPSDEEAGEEDAPPAEPEKADESAKTKADEPMPTGPADDDLLLEVQLAMKGISS